jgi:sRNA-binding protein
MTERPDGLIQTLAELFPNTFTAERYLPHRPLARGIRDVLVGRGVLKPEETRILRYYTSRRMYQVALAAGGDRYDLDGHPCGVVTDEEQACAAAAVTAIDKASAARAEATRQAVRSLRRDGLPRVWKVNPEPAQPQALPQQTRLSLAGLKAAAQARKATAMEVGQ